MISRCYGEFRDDFALFWKTDSESQMDGGTRPDGVDEGRLEAMLNHVWERSVF